MTHMSRAHNKLSLVLLRRARLDLQAGARLFSDHGEQKPLTNKKEDAEQKNMHPNDSLLFTASGQGYFNIHDGVLYAVDTNNQNTLAPFSAGKFKHELITCSLLK